MLPTPRHQGFKNWPIAISLCIVVTMNVRNNDPGAAKAASRAALLLSAPETRIVGNDHNILVGVAGWTDRTLIADGVFYPRGMSSAEARLRFYAEHFPMVEVDSTYYALPSRRVASLWAERTPPKFTFNIKAFALMTGHPTEVSRLPVAIRRELPASIASTDRIYAKDLPVKVLDMVWDHFCDALEPLSITARLGAIFLQFPPWFTATRSSADQLRRIRDRLGHLPAAVEFRNAGWLSTRLADRTLNLLRSLNLAYVCVDEPQGFESSVPPIVAATHNDFAVVRLHGQRAETWEGSGVPVVERYRYLYGESELEHWATRVVELAGQVSTTHVVMNNCYANYGTTNALEIGRLISRVYGERKL